MDFWHAGPFLARGVRVLSLILVDSKSVINSAADILSIVESITCLYSVFGSCSIFS